MLLFFFRMFFNPKAGGSTLLRKGLNFYQNTVSLSRRQCSSPPLNIIGMLDYQY
jgi:hypothetical protein